MSARPRDLARPAPGPTTLWTALILAISTGFAPSASAASSAAESDAPAMEAATVGPAAITATAPALRRARMAAAALDALPVELTDPESRTRWDLSTVRTTASWVVETRAASGEGSEVRTGTGYAAGASAPVRTLVDPAGGEQASAWLFPDRDRDALRLGERRALDLEEGAAPARDRLRIDVETIGIGWVHLPSGPREVALQRALILRRKAHEPTFVPETVIHRWVDPLAGVVAEIEGPASPDGRGRIAITGAQILAELLTPAATLKLHVSEVDTPVLGILN